jgi:hypothetical protein
MMPVTLSLLSALLVTIVLWRAWRGVPQGHAELLAGSEEEDGDLRCPGEFVAALFRREDWEYVAQLESAPLKAMFLSERKCLAEAWVRATAASIRGIINEHALASRRSSDLEIGTEFHIYSQYIALRAACGLLHIAIRVVGPVRLEHQSMRVFKLSERFREAHSAIEAATPIHKLQGI